jgi:hypothetical protein
VDTPHTHELYEYDFPLHCDGCGDSFSALAIIRAAKARERLSVALLEAVETLMPHLGIEPEPDGWKPEKYEVYADTRIFVAIMESARAYREALNG